MSCLSPFLDECSSEGPDDDDDKKKIKITLNGTTNLQLSCTKPNSFSTACRLAARAVFWKIEDILSPAAEKREWSPNCRAIR